MLVTYQIGNHPQNQWVFHEPSSYLSQRQMEKQHHWNPIFSMAISGTYIGGTCIWPMSGQNYTSKICLYIVQYLHLRPCNSFWNTIANLTLLWKTHTHTPCMKVNVVLTSTLWKVCYFHMSSVQNPSIIPLYWSIYRDSQLDYYNLQYIG